MTEYFVSRPTPLTTVAFEVVYKEFEVEKARQVKFLIINYICFAFQVYNLMNVYGNLHNFYNSNQNLHVYHANKVNWISKMKT